MSDADILASARAAASAGAVISKQAFETGFEMKLVDGKASHDLLTSADGESEAAIGACLRERHPEHAILGEETYRDDASSPKLWIVDPIDGTNNFAHRLPHWAVSVAYYENGVPVAGVVINPARDEWYEAVRGGGAWFDRRPVSQTEPSSDRVRVSVSDAESLSEVLVGMGFYYDRGAMMEATLSATADLFREQVHGVRRWGTASLDLAHVGMGYYGGFFEYELSPWDYAAGRLFVTEAGGQVTTCRGEPLPIEKCSVLATNGKLHAVMQGIVEKHLPDGM